MIRYKKTFSIIALILGFHHGIFGQDRSLNEDETENSNKKISKSLEILCDERINKLMKTKLSLNESNPTIEGYRVQIYFASGNNSRKMVNDVRTKFLIKYPSIGAYEVWQAPNFKVRAGDFRTKLEAYKFYKEIKADFPSSFIVKDNITIPKID